MKHQREQSSITNYNSSVKKIQLTRNYIKEKIDSAISQIKVETISSQFFPVQRTTQLSYLKRISLNLQQEKVDRVLTQLRKGYLIKKHSPNTSSPHDKFIYLSEDHRFFCWKSIDKNDQKSLELRKITHVVKGIQGAQSKTILNLPKDRLKNCLIIFSDIRNFQMQANNQEIVSILYEGIQQVVKNSKRMHLSYQF